jgi:hypothetical protein
MRTKLLIALLIVAAFYGGMRFELYLKRPLVIRLEGPKPAVVFQPAGGPIPFQEDQCWWAPFGFNACQIET